MKRRNPKRWPLAQLTRECWAAPNIWVALLEMAAEGGSVIVTPTRKELSERTGIRRLKTISDALTTLTLARWIDRILVTVETEDKRGFASLLKIILRYGGQYVTAIRRTRMGGSRRPSSEGRQTPPDFPKGKRASRRGVCDARLTPPPKAQAKTKKETTAAVDPDEPLVPIVELIRG